MRLAWCCALTLVCIPVSLFTALERSPAVQGSQLELHRVMLFVQQDESELQNLLFHPEKDFKNVILLFIIILFRFKCFFHCVANVSPFLLADTIVCKMNYIT